MVFGKELAVIFTGALPISELRGAIPLAIGFGFSISKSYFLSLFGNLIPVVPVLFFLRKLAQVFSEHSRWGKNFFDWLFMRTRRRSKIIERYGTIGLTIFVAIPLPFTGAWTGCVAAVLLGLPKGLAILAITAGVVLAGVIVTLATLGVVSIF